MQLREYLAILRRFWPLVLLLPLLAAGLSLAAALGQPTRYYAAARLMVTHTPLAPAAAADLPDYNNSFSWLTSEYVLDDLPQIVTSRIFADDVLPLVAAQGYTVEPMAIQTGLRAEVLHRSVMLSATADSPELAQAFVRAAAEALGTNGLKYWNRRPPDGPGLQVAVIDPPIGATPLSGMRDQILDVGLRTALALAAAVGLAFLLHYLDDRLRGPRQAEQWIGARVLGVIPKE